MGDVIRMGRRRRPLDGLTIERFEFSRDRVVRWQKANKRDAIEILVADFVPWPVVRRTMHSDDASAVRYLVELRRGSKVVATIDIGAEELSCAKTLMQTVVAADATLVIEARETDQFRAAVAHVLRYAVENQLLEEEAACVVTGWVGTEAGMVYSTRDACIGPGVLRYVGPGERHLAKLPEPSRHELVPALEAAFLSPINEIADETVAAFFDWMWIAPPTIRPLLGGRAVHLLLIGSTGAGKTVLAKHAASAEVPKSELCEVSWNSTVNAIERSLGIAGDQLVVLDDLKLGTVNHNDVLRIIQTLADGTGRDRMNADMSKGASFRARAIGVSTAEDMIESESSAYGRTLQIELSSGHIDARALADDAHWGENARIVRAHFAQWFAGQFEQLVERGRRYMAAEREAMKIQVPEIGHSRQYETSSAVLAAYRLFLDFVVEHVPHFADVTDDELRVHRAAMARILDGMREVVLENKVGALFVSDLRSLYFSGRIRIAGLDEDGTGSHAKLVGFVDAQPHGEVLYVEPGAALTAIAQARSGADRSKWSRASLGRELKTEGYLHAWDKGQTTIKKSWGKGRPRMWALKLDRFLGRSDDAR